MKMRLLSVCLTLLAAAPALAQGVAAAKADIVFATGGVSARAFEILEAQPPESMSRVKDAPFSADAVTEFAQQLADGNRIERTFTSSLARDSQGRTRREEQIALVGPLAVNGQAPRLVTIVDPVAQRHYTLDERQKIAFRMPAPSVKVLTAGAGSGVLAGEMAKLARFEAGKIVTRLELDPLMLGGAPFDAALRAPNSRIEQLGTRRIEGVEAEGTRTTMTIAAGAIGNQLPIDVVSERWYSKELQTPVLITRNDPRSGETIYRLINIVRAEPPADLFAVPAGYTIQSRKDVFMTRPIGKAEVKK